MFSFQGKFSYGPLDMAALTSERVDIHIMKGGLPQFYSPNSIYFFSVPNFRIRDIFGMDPDPCLWLTEPDPAIFVSDLRDGNLKIISFF